ncbi:MAG: glycosyltransferase family 4 protein, partial [Chitinophagaceae bacterium]|nr:glycosyltransferase family 4 protein [Anaerolineae bacterium]
LVGFHDLNYGLQRSAFSRWTVGQALYGADRVIVACTYAKGLIAQAGYRIPDEAVHIIPLGVDMEIFMPNDVKPTLNHLIHVASLVSVKDQATLLRAIARLEDVTLDIVGEGQEREKLTNLAAVLGISEKVNFVGNIPHLAMPPFYQRAVLHILTSRHEGLGMVTLEAAACGIPTISTAVGIVPDYPELGVSLPVGDDAALATEIRYLLNQPEHRETLGKSAFTLTQEKFSIQQTAQKFRQVYEDLQAKR